MDKGKQYICDPCGLILGQDDVQVLYPDIPDLLNRMEPGGEVPAGECPFCGALVYLDENTKPEE